MTPNCVKASRTTGRRRLPPVVGARLAQAEQLAHHDLQRVGLQVDQDKEQLLLNCPEGTVPSAAGQSLALLAGHSLLTFISAPIGCGERREQRLELLEG
jgi:hypothetical protein